MFQLSKSAVQLLQAGETLLFGQHPDNLARAEILGPGHLHGSARVRLLEDHRTDRPYGNSFRRAGFEFTVMAAELWHTVDFWSTP